MLVDGRAAIAGSWAMATALNAVAVGSRLQSCCRQRNSWLVCIPASRATSDATAPGSSAAATIRSFSARDQRRRRCTDVITSTCIFVIVLALGLVLGLATNLNCARRPSPGAHWRSAANPRGFLFPQTLPWRLALERKNLRIQRCKRLCREMTSFCRKMTNTRRASVANYDTCAAGGVKMKQERYRVCAVCGRRHGLTG
jgi:hypothetical protein